MFRAKAEPKMTISAVVTRADGTKEDLGIIASGTLNSCNKKKSFLQRLLDFFIRRHK